MPRGGGIIHLRGSSSLTRRGSQPLYPDPRKTSTLTSRRPEIPRCIPRAKLLEQGCGNEDIIEMPSEEVSQGSSLDFFKNFGEGDLH